MTEEVIAHLKETNGSSIFPLLSGETLWDKKLALEGGIFCLFFNTKEHKPPGLPCCESTPTMGCRSLKKG